jgi:hypothetical protein
MHTLFLHSVFANIFLALSNIAELSAVIKGRDLEDLISVYLALSPTAKMSK